MTRFGKELSDILTDLIIDQERGEPLRLPPNSRALLLQGLESVLANPRRLNEHCQFLKGRLTPGSHSRESLGEGTTQDIMERGLGALEDNALARLALSPIALYALGDVLEDEYPQFWREALRRETRAFLQETGVPVPEAPSWPDVKTGGSPTRDAPPLAAISLTSPAEPVEGGQLIFEAVFRPEQCQWAPAQPAILPAATAAVEVYRTDGGLRVMAGGFLRVRPGSTLEATWMAADGAERARARPANRFSPVVELTAADRQVLRPGDRLVIHLSSLPLQAGGWEVRLVVSLA